jgi:cell division protein FtsZ
MIELVENVDPGARIKVIGAGGCGGNAVNHMIAAGLRNVDFIAVNTDTQALQNNIAPLVIQMGTQLTRGRGTGGNPEIGRKAALEDEDRLREVLGDAEMVFVTAGMGGGTGTGSAPVIARIARESGALTVGVVTKPFQFEGRKRMGQAEEGLRELKNAVDTLITIPNQRLLSIASRTTSLKEAFQKADDVLLQAVRGIAELVTVHGLINLDFADVRSIMAEMGMAMMGAARAAGENRAVEAAQRAISSPLLEDVSIKGARGLLINVTGGPDMSLYEVNEAASLIQEEAHEDANIIFGAVIDEKISDEIHVTVIATGFGDRDFSMRHTPSYASVSAPQSHAPISAQSSYAPIPAPPAYSPSGTPVTAPVMTSPTRPMEDPVQRPLIAPAVHHHQPAAVPSIPPHVTSYGGKPVRRLGLIVDENSLDIPAFKRRNGEAQRGGPTRLSSNDAIENEDKLDIPAFLRKPVD